MTYNSNKPQLYSIQQIQSKVLKLHFILDLQSWSELLAPLVAMIKDGCKKYICNVYPFDLSFKLILNHMYQYNKTCP